MSTFIRARRAHFRLASGVIVRDLFAPAKLARCSIDPNIAVPSQISNLVAVNSSVIKSLTGTVNETQLGTIVIPGKSMGQNGWCRLSCLWNATANANVKTCRARLGGIAGTDLIGAFNAGANGFFMTLTHFYNQNAFNVQTAFTFYTPPAYFAPFVTAAAIDTSVDQPIAITGQLANGGDTLNLDSYLCEIFRF